MMPQYKLKTSVMYFINGHRLFNFLVFICCLLTINNAYATHSSGADLQYRWISGKTYQVTVSFYRDCAGVAAPASITLNARSSSCGQNQDYTLNLVGGTGQEITFPCRFVQTICNNSSSLYAGYQQFDYTNTITLPSYCTDWIFSFYVCCRNCAITTLNNPCSDNMYIEATLNNIAAPTNSSPRFTNTPVAMICTNQNFTYNHGVIDPNGDSLVYSFVKPKTYNTGSSTVGTVTYNPGYSATQPLTSSPAVTINSFNGDISMFPTVNGEIGVTAILVREYRNGVLIGSVIRDMQFLTRVCNPNFLPSSTGMNGTADFDTSACPGNSISFTVNCTDPNPGDTVVMTWNNAIPGATFNTVGALLPQGTFTWTPTLADARSQPYSFTVTVRDNSCPLKGSQTYSFSILVPLMEVTVSSPLFNGYNVACRGVGTGSIAATGNGGGLPYTYIWAPSGQTTQTAINLTAQLYTVTLSDVHGCTASASTTLTQPPTVVSINVSSTTNVSCNGGSNGTGTVAGAGGIGPYTYLWTPSAQTTATATGLSASIYTARVTDQNGCTSQQAIAITQPLVLSPSISTFQNVTCQGNSNGSISVVVSGGTAPYTHRWSSGQIAGTIAGLAPGTYTDTVRDSKGCQQIISQVISQPGSAVSIPSSSISTTNVSCFGLTNGTANVNPTGGTPAYNVTWSNGDIGNSADTLGAGIYNVHIVDGNGCTFDTAVTITEPAVLNSSFANYSTAPSGTNIRCNGDTTGHVKVVPSGGTSPFTYSWSNGATIDSIKNVSAGTYIVRVTDFKGCTFLDTTTLTQPSLLEDSLRVRHVGCKGESTGGIRAVSYGGSPIYTYVWSHGAFLGDTVGNLPAGFYQVTITDTNNCQVIDTITIVEPDTLVPLILPSTYIGSVNVACNGDTSGSATLNVFGGTRPFTYTWSHAGVDSFVTGLSAGIVSVHVVDANGCSITRDTVLDQPPPFVYAPVKRNPFCYRDSTGYITLNTSGSTGPYTYVWSNGATTDSIGNIPSGTYSVIVNDANGCEDSVAHILYDPDTLTAFATISDNLGFNNSCNGDSSAYIALHVSGGNGSYNYLWNTFDTTDSIFNLSNGTYSVTILDGFGCRKDTTVVLSQPPLVVPSLTLSLYNGGLNVSCNDFIDGTARASVVGGVPPYQYLWSNGDVADSALGLGAGPHTLTVTDANGCVTVIPFVFTEPPPITISPTLSNFNGFNIPCYGDSLASVTIGVSGGIGPYLYVWEFQDTIVSSTLSNLPADTFSVRIIDVNGCQLDTTFILTAPSQIIDSTSLSGYNGYQIQCNGFSNGNIDVSMLGGVGPFSYLWSTTDTTEDLSNLPAGIYQLIVTDANSCVDTFSYTLTEPPVITSVVTMNGATCSQNNGSALATVISGLTPYTYSWTPSGQTTASATNIPAGWHTITVTDSVGCTQSDSIFVDAIPVIGLNFSGQVNNVCPGFSNGFVQAGTTGGVSPFTYLWSNGDTNTFTGNLPSGYISVSITDASGCVEIDSVLITEPPAFSASYVVTNAFCAGVNNGTAQVTLSGGNPPYQILWSNGDTGSNADSLSGGYAVVSFTDNSGCAGVDSVNIIQLPSLSSTVASSTDVTCNGAANGSATVNPVTGGAPPYSYVWSNGDVGLTANSLSGGIVTITITDNNSCTAIIPVTINEPAMLIASVVSQPLSCDDVNDGRATATVTGGTPAYIYIWTPNVSSDSIAADLKAGTYLLTVTDLNNCSDTATSIILIGDCDLDLPSGFSPNGDGFDDYYVVHGLTRYPFNIFKVFNRWGNEVFSVENYSNSEWYGQNSDGEKLPEGSYFVIFKDKNSDVTKNSFVDLRR